MTVCRALVAGFGRPAMRDLDFGRQVIDCLQQLDWPEGVVVEDLSCSVPLVLDRLQELRPAKVVLLGAVARDLDPPATIRRYRPDVVVPAEAAPLTTDLVDIDHTLALALQWGGLPPDTVVIEVEPAETSFGLGFSEELAGCIDPIMEMVCEEVGGVADVELDVPEPEPDRVEASEPMSDLLAYASEHADARLQSRRAPSLAVPGLALAGRVRPWGVFVRNGSDWFDAVPLANGSVGIVVGEVAGRGVEVAAAMADLRAAVRAYAVVDGDSPSRLVAHLDRLAEATGVGREACVIYLALDPATGNIRFVNAGGCPPLVAGGDFVDGATSAPIGLGGGEERPEGSLTLARDSTLLLFTDGLVQSRLRSRAAGLDRLRRAAAAASRTPFLDELCDDVVTACTTGLRRDDDICLLGVRLEPAAVPARNR
ncbi:MAG: hydrogenase maturation protease [Actinomycetota bacterium]|nr:hydrogenase maturation protease [Actinomycetota bacterium]